MKNIIPYCGILPTIDKSVFVAPNAIITGDTIIGKNSSVWFSCVIRGDVEKIRIGENTNIQDGTVVHVTRANHAANKTGDKGAPVTIGNNVTIGHSAIIHACTIQDNAFVGMGAIVMDMAIVEEYGMLAAGAILTPHKVVKKGQLWAGNPARYFRDLTDIEKDYIQISADNYRDLAAQYK